jgi:hypothetical protein
MQAQARKLPTITRNEKDDTQDKIVPIPPNPKIAVRDILLSLSALRSMTIVSVFKRQTTCLSGDVDSNERRAKNRKRFTWMDEFKELLTVERKRPLG